MFKYTYLYWHCKQNTDCQKKKKISWFHNLKRGQDDQKFVQYENNVKKGLGSQALENSYILRVNIRNASMLTLKDNLWCSCYVLDSLDINS